MKITTLQGRSSANTSTNNIKLPAAFTKITPRGHICDYGCGKYTDHIRTHCDFSGALSYNPYDPYNQEKFVNESTKRMAQNHGFDMVYCCNVLNVIDNPEAIFDILCEMIKWCNVYGTLVIQIYEGDKSGIGKETKFDCWQRNEKTEEYIKYIDRAFKWFKESYSLERKSNILIIKLEG